MLYCYKNSGLIMLYAFVAVSLKHQSPVCPFMCLSGHWLVDHRSCDNGTSIHFGLSVWGLLLIHLFKFLQPFKVPLDFLAFILASDLDDVIVSKKTKTKFWPVDCKYLVNVQEHCFAVGYAFLKSANIWQNRGCLTNVIETCLHIGVSVDFYM